MSFPSKVATVKYTIHLSEEERVFRSVLCGTTNYNYATHKSEYFKIGNLAVYDPIQYCEACISKLDPIELLSYLEL